MANATMVRIRAQRALSDRVLNALRPVMHAAYFRSVAPGDIVCGDLGSYPRGTDTTQCPDLDLGFFGAVLDTALGHVDWTPLDARKMSGRKEGFTTLAELEAVDPVARRVVDDSRRVLDDLFALPDGSTRFAYTRTWAGYPGWVSNLSVPRAQGGPIEVDLNLGYEPGHYGLDHARRFSTFFERLVGEQGEAAAALLIEDIRLLKQLGKDRARDADGWIDRTRKIFGFLVEGLFMHRYPPLSWEELMAGIRAHRWLPDRVPTEHWCGDQADPVIGAGWTLGALLENVAVDNLALPLGAWENVLGIAHDYPGRPGS